MEPVPRRVRSVLRAPEARARLDPRGAGREPPAQARAGRARAGDRRRGARRGRAGARRSARSGICSRSGADRLRAAPRRRRHLPRVPRRACDSLFAKRDAARDTEANAHHAELDAIRAELEAVTGAQPGEGEAGASWWRARSPSAPGPASTRVRRRGRGDGARDRHGAPRRREGHRARSGAAARPPREADRARRGALPKQPEPAAAEAGDVATRLKQAMSKNAFSELRFSGRDPIEVLDELRASWAEAGPFLDDADRESGGALRRRDRPRARRSVDPRRGPPRAQAGGRAGQRGGERGDDGERGGRAPPAPRSL